MLVLQIYNMAKQQGTLPRFRLNTTNVDPKDLTKVAQMIRAAARQVGIKKGDVRMFYDLSGAKIRVGSLPAEGEVKLEPVTTFTLSYGDAPSSKTSASINFRNLGTDAKPNDVLTLRRGRIQLKVIKVSRDEKGQRRTADEGAQGRQAPRRVRRDSARQRPRLSQRARRDQPCESRGRVTQRLETAPQLTGAAAAALPTATAPSASLHWPCSPPFAASADGERCADLQPRRAEAIAGQGGEMRKPPLLPLW